MYIKDKKGFTLVELLAVIVVLAIVMLIAVQAILPRMEEARRSVFALEANEAINAATTYWTNQSLKGSGGFPIDETSAKCVGIAKLIDEGYLDMNKAGDDQTGGYSGFVKVQKKANIYLYTIYIQKNATMMLDGEGNDGKNNIDIPAGNVKSYSTKSYYTNDIEDSCPTTTTTTP